MLAAALVLLASAVAAATDLRTRRIPNAVPAALLLAGLVLHATQGWENAAISIALCLVVFALGTMLFSFNLIGGGDVKLLAAAAATLGWPHTLAFLLYTILAGGVLGIAIAVARGRLRPMLANMRAMLFPMLSGIRPGTVTPVAGSMPYGLAIFAGAASAALGSALGLG